ncbi:VWA domain-containing protein [Candidatus Woesearchaeota archaeon]|nr:VWA domain-containing protein [Candidatus Woesearchaeota archaeon]
MTFIGTGLELAYRYFEQPFAILLIIPVIIILYFVLRKRFVKVKEDPDVVKQKKFLQRILFVTRVLIFILLLVAIASPYYQTSKVIKGDAFVKVLVDNSTSMELFESISGELAKNLEKQLTVEMKSIGEGEQSAIGDAILNSLEPHDSIVLISDGNSNYGADLGDVALFAGKLNSSINVIDLNPIHDDAGIIILGPAKSQEGIENKYTAIINRVGKVTDTPVKISYDGEVVYDQSTKETIIQFTKMMTPGYHKISAQIQSNDYFPQNNVYHKTVKVVQKPKIFFYTEEASPMKTLLDQIYVVDSGNSLPPLNDYYAVAINNINADTLKATTDVLNDFVADGNGMVAIGGDNSFDRGDYKNSLFETLLPVYVSAPGKKEGETSIVVVVDISGSTSAQFGSDTTVDVEKALALGAYRDLSMNTRLAVVAFNTKAYLVSEPSYVYEKQNLEDKISRLSHGGGTLVSAGMLKAISILEEMAGGKNIILISDGKTQAESAATEAAKLATNLGIKIYTVGVGPTTNEPLMQQIAQLAHGIYFKATESSRLKILFGDLDEEEQKSNKMNLQILDSNHFITAGIEPKAAIYGFNNGMPKTTARLLATTSTGDPLLTIWRLGLGRIAALTTDDGTEWAGELLSKQNSNLVTRTFNWAIGDPDRKSAEFIDIQDTRINEPTEIIVKSKTVPKSEQNVFYKIDEDMYASTITPTATGFQQILTATFAVNYPAEYEMMGFNRELKSIAESTGGRVFDKSDVDGIIEFTKTKAKRSVVTKQTIRQPLIIAAIILLLIEIFIRRITRKD